MRSTTVKIQSKTMRNQYFRYKSDCIDQKKLTLDFNSLAIFHFVLFLLLIPKTKNVKIINEGMWIIKLIFLAIIITIVDLTFGPSSSDTMQMIVTWVSPVMYIIMNIVIVDFIYFIDFRLFQISQKHRKVHIIKVAFSIIIWISAIVINVYSYFQNYVWMSVCNSVLLAAFLLITFLRISKNNSLFVYSLISLHLNCISYSIHYEVGEKQNYLGIAEHGYRIFVGILTIFAMLAQGGNQIRTKKSTINQILALNTSKRQQDNRYVSSNKWIIYHLMMTLIAFSFPAVFAYQQNAMDNQVGQYIDIGRIVWWVSLVLIYLWSIMAQKIYPQQDLSQLENYFKQFQLN